MINNVLYAIQRGDISIEKEKLQIILDATLELEERLRGQQGREFLVDALIPFVAEGYDVKNKLCEVVEDTKIQETLVKSSTTTTNVNNRLKRVKEILGI